MKRESNSMLAEPRYTIRIDDFIDSVEDGQVISYENNRGSGKKSSATTRDVRFNLHLPSLGLFVGARFGDVLKLADANSRMEGLRLRRQDGNLTPEEAAYEIDIKEVSPDEFMKVYQITNSGKAHTAGNDLDNPDYFLGGIIHKIKKEISAEHHQYIKQSTKTSNIAYLIYAYAHGVEISKGCGYADVFLCRQACKHLYKHLATETPPFTISRDLWSKLVHGLEFYGDYCQELTEQSIKTKAPVKKILKSGPLMSMIIMDQMRDRPRCTRPKTLSDRTIRNIDKLSQIVPLITGSDRETIMSMESQAWRSLSGRS